MSSPFANFDQIERNDLKVSVTATLTKTHQISIHSDLQLLLISLISQVDKLVSVKGVNNRYRGEIGDVVVGRITEVQQKKWKVFLIYLSS